MSVTEAPSEELFSHKNDNRKNFLIFRSDHPNFAVQQGVIAFMMVGRSFTSDRLHCALNGSVDDAFIFGGCLRERRSIAVVCGEFMKWEARFCC